MTATTPPANQTRIFFPNLDGLRFICFFAVFLHHCYLSYFSYLQNSSPGFYATQAFLFKYGTLGVNFFFVLSGFLITYLLIKEKEVTGTVHIGKFYVRRILRIWPLYYLIVVLGFVLLPMLKQMTGEASPPENADLWSYIFFVGNFDYMNTWPVKPEAIVLSVLWSVCVEEQFYLLWPVLLRFVPVKGYKYVFLAVILTSLIFRAFYSTDCAEDSHQYGVRYFHSLSLIGDMALGALLAYFTSYTNRFKDFVINLSRPAIAFIYIGAIAVCLFNSLLFTCGIPIIFERLLIGLFFGFIILEQNFARNSFFKFGKIQWLSKLGTYTYGLYCLHLLGMYLAIKISLKLGWREDNLGTAIASAVLALVLSIVISIASYHLFEKWFLRLKNKFAFITR
jgi:peptidoglycan/LPS O-acetylase OafA/YrhL